MKTLPLLCMAFLLCVRLSAQIIQEPECFVQPDAISWSGQTGGRSISSKGDLNALVLFIQFPDDSLDVNNPEWTKNQAPARMKVWVDSVWSPNATPYSMTDYYNQMSLNSFHFTAKTRFVITPRTRQQYRALGMKRKDIYREVLKKLDSTMDFAEFDHWSIDSPYVHRYQYDKVVDMIVGIWRNIKDDNIDKKYQDSVASQLKFTDDEADLGIGVDGEYILVDSGNGDRKVMVNTSPYKDSLGWHVNGSGVTVRKGYITQGPPNIMQVTIHEVGHYLMGRNEYHVGFGSWGMVASYGHRCFVANSYERHRLGWMNLVTVANTSQTLENASLPDYVTSGIAYRLVVDSTRGRYIFLENHQRISRWDIPDLSDTAARGLYVLRQDTSVGPYGDFSQLRMVPADGDYDWLVHRWETSSCCGSQLLPVFKQLDPDRHHGWNDCDIIHFTDPLTNTDKSFQLILREGLHGETVLDSRFSGDGKDAFRPGYATVFSPWSNPPSDDVDRNPTGFGFEIVGTTQTANGDEYILNIYSQTAKDAAPAIPQALKIVSDSVSPHQKLFWQRNEEPDLKSYRIYRSATPQGSQGVEYTCSEPTAWTLLTTLNAFSSSSQPVTSWTDTNPPQMDDQDMCMWYRIAAVDSTDKESLKSNIVKVVIPAAVQPLPGNGKRSASTMDNEGRSIILSGGQPNPADGQTTIHCFIKAGWMKLTVQNMFGEQVYTLAGQHEAGGDYSFTIDTAALPEGVYFCTLQTDSESRTEKLVVRH